MMELGTAHIAISPDLSTFEDDLRLQIAEALENIAADLRRR